MPDGSFETAWMPTVETPDTGAASGRAGEPDDPVAIAAAARFAELAAEAAVANALSRARQETAAEARDAADPLDQVAADWAARIEADEQIVHAFLGIDDPIAREAEDAFTQAAVEAELDALLERLPGAASVDGELAALDAFDAALARGADAEEALSAAIRAAESVDDATGALAPIGIPVALADGGRDDDPRGATAAGNRPGCDDPSAAAPR